MIPSFVRDGRPNKMHVVLALNKMTEPPAYLGVSSSRHTLRQSPGPIPYLTYWNISVTRFHWQMQRGVFSVVRAQSNQWYESNLPPRPMYGQGTAETRQLKVRLWHSEFA